jgi:tripeptidyl-peptidase I
MVCSCRASLLLLALLSLVVPTGSVRVHLNEAAYTRFSHVARASSHATHRIVFAIKQNGQTALEDILVDTSSPTSPKYGHHLSRDEVAAITADRQRTKAVVQFLKRNKGVDIDYETTYGEYVVASAPVRVWETMLSTSFSVYEDAVGRHRIRCTSYELPAQLTHHVDILINANDVSKLEFYCIPMHAEV